MIDEALRPFATERQWELYCAVQEHGSHRAAARALNLQHHSTVSRSLAAMRANAARRGYSPDHDMIHPAPEGFRVKGTSTLYDLASGEARMQWVKTATDGSDEAIQAILDGLKDEVPSVAPSAPPEHVLPALMASYPIGDHHIGMLAHRAETGDNYDISIGEDLLRGAMERLTMAAPACETALVAVLGDFLHFDGWSAVTPTSGHLVDADGRFYKLVRAALRSIRHAVACALHRHRQVHLSITIGNHDLSAAVWLMEALAMFYESEPRVQVDTSPSHFKYHRFGRNLIGLHHGHGKAAKPGDLPGIMACDRAEDWGETLHRTWYTGHVHTRQFFEAPGCSVESFRILPPADAYAANNGYRSQREMQAIIYHEEHGEIERHRVTPLMLEAA